MVKKFLPLLRQEFFDLSENHFYLHSRLALQIVRGDESFLDRHKSRFLPA